MLADWIGKREYKEGKNGEDWGLIAAVGIYNGIEEVMASMGVETSGKFMVGHASNGLSRSSRRSNNNGSRRIY